MQGDKECSAGADDPKSTMAFFSTINKQVSKGDIKKEFYKMGMDVNLDGKMQYFNLI